MNSKKKKKKKKKSKSSSNTDDASIDSPMTLSNSLTANGGVDGDSVASNDEDVELGDTADAGDAEIRSSPKKKKKKKKEREKKRLIIPDFVADTRKSEPRIGKIVIVNGTKIQSQPGSPTIPAPAKSLSPLSLRSASPKITLKTDPAADSEAMVVPPPENSSALESLGAEAAVAAAAAVVDIAKRKRQLSADLASGKKVAFKSRKRLRTASQKEANNVDAAAANDEPINATTPTTTHLPTKVLPASNSREDKTSVRSLSVTPSSTPILGGRRRETPTGYPAINLSDNLKRHLNNDFEMVTKKRRLNSLPAEPNIVSVLEDFVRHYSSGRLVAFEKHQRKSLYTAHRRDTGEMTYQRAIESIQVKTRAASSRLHLSSKLLMAQFLLVVVRMPPIASSTKTELIA